MRLLAFAQATALALGMVSSFGTAHGADSQITFDLMHTKPNCENAGMSSTWCTMDGFNDAAKKSGMVTKIKKMLDQYALDKIVPGKPMPRVFVAYFSFSNKPIQGKLCDIGKAGIPLEIVLDVASRGDGEKVAGCSKDPSKPNVKVSYLGGLTSEPWRLHHNKFLYINPGDGTPVSLNFSSGNLSAFGTSLHLDHWVTMTAPETSNLVQAHECVIDGLRAAISKADQTGMYKDGSADAQFDGVVAGAYVSTRDKCYQTKNLISMTNSDKALAQDGISASFSPNNSDEVFQVFEREVDRVTAVAKSGKPAYLYIAIQHFLHQPTFYALKRAADAGVDVRIVMDDDVVLGSSEVSGVGEFYQYSLKQAGFKIRFAQTNAEVRQMMHNKLTILNGKRSFSGAGHFTSAAFRDNWENFYLIENEALVKKYLIYFKELWEKSVSEGAANGTGENTQPEKLSAEALKLIGQ